MRNGENERRKYIKIINDNKKISVPGLFLCLNLERREHMNLSYRSNNFSRVAANEAKMGAYYTDPAHCKAIGEMFEFPEECTLLEPSIGDGKAVLSLLNGYAGASVFGVEINESVATKTREQEGIEECLLADFLDGVIISQNAFSLCFCNPPYMDDEIGNDGRERMEKTFLTKITRYLKKGGVLVFVIPERILPIVGRILMGNYEMKALYRFWPDEYAKWKQVVYVGVKTDKKFCSKDEMTSFMNQISQMKELPVHPSERIKIPHVKRQDIKTFCCKEFNEQAAYEYLRGKEIISQMNDYERLMNKLTTQKKHASTEVGRPPIPLKKDLLYLMSTSGIGQGLAGTEGVDLHLQRGCAEIIEESELLENYDPKKANEMRVTSRTQITMKIIQSDGTISTLS